MKFSTSKCFSIKVCKLTVPNEDMSEELHLYEEKKYVNSNKVLTQLLIKLFSYWLCKQKQVQTCLKALDKQYIDSCLSKGHGGIQVFASPVH